MGKCKTIVASRFRHDHDQPEHSGSKDVERVSEIWRELATALRQAS